MTTTINPPPAEAAAPDQGRRRKLPRPPATRPNWLRVALGVALAVVVVLGINAYTRSATQSTAVLALQSDVARGETVEEADLMVVQIPGVESGLDAVAAEDRDSIIGQIAAHDLLAGTTLTPAAVTSQLTPGPGQSVVGVALSQSQMPGQPFVAGDQVRVVEISPTGGSVAVESLPTYDAEVLTVQSVGSGITVVDLLVDADTAGDVASRAAAGRLALVLDPTGR